MAILLLYECMKLYVYAMNTALEIAVHDSLQEPATEYKNQNRDKRRNARQAAIGIEVWGGAIWEII